MKKGPCAGLSLLQDFFTFFTGYSHKIHTHLTTNMLTSMQSRTLLLQRNPSCDLVYSVCPSSSFLSSCRYSASVRDPPPPRRVVSQGRVARTPSLQGIITNST